MIEMNHMWSYSYLYILCLYFLSRNKVVANVHKAKRACSPHTHTGQVDKDNLWNQTCIFIYIFSDFSELIEFSSLNSKYQNPYPLSLSHFPLPRPCLCPCPCEYDPYSFLNILHFFPFSFILTPSSLHLLNFPFFLPSLNFYLLYIYIYFTLRRLRWVMGQGTCQASK